MTASNPSSDPIHDSDWLAVRYLLGELSGGEAVELENRLANEQTIREALAGATTLVETLAMTQALPVVRPSAQPMRRRMFAASAATAAALCVGLLGYLAFEPTPRGIVVRQSMSSIDPARLAVLWVDSAASLNGIPEAEAVYESASVDPQLALLPPDWLLAAVEQEAALSPNSPAFDTDADAIERN